MSHFIYHRTGGSDSPLTSEGQGDICSLTPRPRHDKLKNGLSKSSRATQKVPERPCLQMKKPCSEMRCLARGQPAPRANAREVPTGHPVSCNILSYPSPCPFPSTFLPPQPLPSIAASLPVVTFQHSTCSPKATKMPPYPKAFLGGTVQAHLTPVPTWPDKVFKRTALSRCLLAYGVNWRDPPPET